MIRNKKTMKQMLLAGRFGNSVRQWGTLAELDRDGYTGPVYVRTNKKSDTVKAFEVPRNQLWTLDLDFSKCTFYEAPPNNWRVIQGDVMRTPDGLYLFYSTMKAPLRIAQNEQPRHVYTLAAEMILRRNLTPQSYDHLIGLVDKHDDAVVEFTEFDRPTGTDNRHLVIWEVRNY